MGAACRIPAVPLEEHEQLQRKCEQLESDHEKLSTEHDRLTRAHAQGDFRFALL
jgi:hypothetical protein